MPFDLQPAPPSLVGLAGWLLALKGLALFMIMKTPHSRPSLYHSWMGKYTGHAAVHYKKKLLLPHGHFGLQIDTRLETLKKIFWGMLRFSFNGGLAITWMNGIHD